MDTLSVKVVVVFCLTFVLQWNSIRGVCYFPQQFQGDFVMQSSTDNNGTSIQYATVEINVASIPIWGMCHRRIGNNFILVLNYMETTCVRCLHLKLRSSNVLQVFTLNQEVLSQCYTTEELAEANCPSEESLANREAAEILLFKTKDINGQFTKKEYCPIDGRYSVRYQIKNPKKMNRCPESDSTLDTCPSGSVLNIRLKGCTANNHELKFECLGGWSAPDSNENFLIFTDNRVATGHTKAKYRCAIYKQDPQSGIIQMALSRDSTCTNLTEASHGYETFTFYPKSESEWPVEVSSGVCSFPKWMHGNWEHLRITADTMIYRDHSSFKTYTIKCAGEDEGEDKYLIFSRSQCNEESYNCMRIVKRINNILEFKLGTNASNSKDVTVCSDENFVDVPWITQGRTDISALGTPSGECPISGEYVGKIPDGDNLCAKLWSDCDASDLMYYQVSHCITREIFEDREYQCLGHWVENKFLYTYTQRRDVAANTYECFVGVKVSNREIYIKEAGEHCQRSDDQFQYGMQLNKTSLFTCNSTTARTPSSVKTTRIPSRRPAASSTTIKSTTRVWNFDSAGVEKKDNSNPSSASAGPKSATSYLLLCIFVYLRFK